MGVFLNASQNWTVARNLIFHMVMGLPNGSAKTVISHTKVNIFRYCLHKMMAGCRVLGRRDLGRNLQI